MLNIGDVLIMSVVMGLFGLLILIPLWPNAERGRALLLRWGVEDPVDEQTDQAVRYLKRRRIWYPWLYLILGSATAVLSGADDDSLSWYLSIMATLLVGALLAELIAMRPEASSRREAGLRRRGLSDLVPRWAVALQLVVFAAALVVPVIGFGEPTGSGPLGPWGTIAAPLGCGAVVAMVLWIAVVRPAHGDLAVDNALRIRSGRIALGLGTAVHALIIQGAVQPFGDAQRLPSLAGLGFVLAGLLTWFVLAKPPRRSEPVNA